MKKQLTGVLGGSLKVYRILLFTVIFLIFGLFLSPNTYAATETGEAEFTPWSGYWWPYYRGGLATGLDYRGNPAPVEKYEMLTRGSYPQDLTTWYKDKYYDPDAPGWFGLCLYWAWASVYENITFLPSSLDNIVFRVGDKKGLLTLTHNDDIIESEYVHSPDVFHYWLMYYIKEQRKAFVADLDSSDEIWSYPVFRYDMETRTDASTEHVEVTIYYANDFVHPDYMGTDIKQQTYTYDLYVSGGAITGGEWTGSSVSDHPDRVTIPIVSQTNCPYLDYQKILEIAQSEDDFLESGTDTVALHPGTYNLILMDEDRYSFDGSSGDVIRLAVEKQNGSTQDMVISITDAAGNAVAENRIVTEDDPLELILSEAVPPYAIVLTQNDYSDPNIYTLKFDIQRNTTQTVPYIPKNGMWSGFALTNPGDTPVEDVTLTTYTEEGQPLQTLLGPMTMASGERQVFLFTDLPYRQHELSDTESLKLMADGDIRMVNLFASSSYERMSVFAQNSADNAETRIIIPDTRAPLDFSRSMSGAVMNKMFDDLLLNLRLYSEGGTLKKEILNEPLTSRSMLPISPSGYPFYSMPSSGWIDVTEAEGNVLSGFQYVKAGTWSETLFALSADSTHKIVPQIPEPGYWETTVTLINPNDAENVIRFHLRKAGEDLSEDTELRLAPNEKRVVTLHDQYGKSSDDPLHSSILDISAELPVAGYYTFASPNDKADLPLPDSDDLKTDLIMPHYAGNDGFWWTGVGVFNPSESDLTIQGTPYDINGQEMASAGQQIVLFPGEYDVFTVKDRFGENIASEIAFIKFAALEGEKFGGFYLYGNLTNEMLSGANMR